jgi:superfamily II DNA or RNA helicase
MEAITKKDLLKSDPGLKNRPYQLEALLSIFSYLKCVVKMFCGTGKSRIITNVIIHEKKELSVIVFPSLALINQYSADYLNNVEYNTHFKKHKTINISSEILPTIESTTDPKQIRLFLKSKGSKIILVTYQSYKVLLDCLDGTTIGLVCYDEAHHVVSPECQTLVFGTTHFEKEVFFTATPKNENGITMFDRDDPDKNMCGPVAYDYTYLQGLTDEVLNAFEICIDMYTENTNNPIYEAMSRAILARNTNRVLSFHSGVNGESNTNVWNFVNQTEFEIAFNKVQKAEFPEKANDYKKITFKGMDGATSSADRKAMLKALDNTPSNEIYIIASCETIGEGVDTKKANMCVFADPKSSITKIIQNIGRVVRRNNAHPLSTILIPCWVNMENYASANGDREKQDELIRQNMRSEKGDYASILNVLAALRQEDHELYEMCLNYPNRRIKEESLEEQGFRIDEDEYSADEVEQMKKDGEPLEIHTNETIERFNEESSENMTRLYYDAEEELYSTIVRNNSDSDDDSESDEESECEDDRTAIKPPKPKSGIKMSIHQNDDIQILWCVTGDIDFSQKFCSVVIECEVSFGVEQWYNKLKMTCEYMDKHNKRPSEKDKNPEIKKIGSWVSAQKSNYKKHIKIMANPVIRNEWEATLEKYAEYLVVNGDKAWCSIHKNVCEYMDKHKKSPSANDKDPEIKKLGMWVSHQKKNYAKNTEIMKNPVIRNEWEATMEKYAEYLETGEEAWRSTHQNACAYMDKHKKSPSQIDKNPEIKKLGMWFSKQKENYAKNIQIMGNPVIRAEWEATMKKYAPYFADCHEVWYLMHKNACEYMDQYNKSPSANDKNPEIKKLGSWIGHQKSNYSKNVHSMKNPDIRAEWEATMEKYAMYLVSDRYEAWRSSNRNACEYMDKHKKRPSEEDKNPEIKKIGLWVTHQKINYTKNVYIMSNPDIRNEWEATLEKYAEYLKQQIEPKLKIKKQTEIPLTSAESTAPHHFPPPSKIGRLHLKYHRMRSDNLHAKFKEDPQLWREYHDTRKDTFAKYDPPSIPSNQIIRKLEEYKTKRKKVVVDMGCGEAPIAHYFQDKNDNRFIFHNYDHQSGGDPLIQEVDISELPLEDASVEIAIMSLALWGTNENCTQYIKEAYRVLESGGKFYISDSTKKWSPEQLTRENGGELLRTMLTKNGFVIRDENIGSPFCLFVCEKL